MAAIGSDIKTTLSRPGYFGTMIDVAPVSWVPAIQAPMTDAARPTMRAEGGLARDARSELRLHDTPLGDVLREGFGNCRPSCSSIGLDEVDFGYVDDFDLVSNRTRLARPLGAPPLRR